MPTALVDLSSQPTIVYVQSALLFMVAMVSVALLAKFRSLSAALAKSRFLHSRDLERVNLALEGADEALWDWNVAQNRTYYSDRWSGMLGFRPDEVGESVDIWERLIHPSDRLAALEKLQAHMAGQCEAYEAEFRMQAKDGGWRWIRARGRVVTRAPDGSPVRVAGTHLDITAHKQAEEALIREQNLLRTLVDNLPDLIYVKDLESRFLLINQALAATLGVRTPAEALGKTDFDFYPENMAVRLKSRGNDRIAIRNPAKAFERPKPFLDRALQPILQRVVRVRQACDGELRPV